LIRYVLILRNYVFGTFNDEITFGEKIIPVPFRGFLIRIEQHDSRKRQRRA